MKEEIAKVIEELNEYVFDLSEGRDYVLWFEHVCLPIGDYVKYAGQYIFDSENDYRPYVDEELDIRQDLKEYLLEQISLISEFILQTIK